MSKALLKTVTGSLILLVTITACIQLPDEILVEDDAVPVAEPVSAVEGSATERSETEASETEASETAVTGTGTPETTAETEATVATNDVRTAEDDAAAEAVEARAEEAVTADAADEEPAAVAPGHEKTMALARAAEAQRYMEHVNTLCHQVGNKLGSVSVDDCLRQQFHFGGGFSINQRPLVIKEMPSEKHGADSIRIFLMGGIHGDEYSSISIIFKWLELFSADSPEGNFYWRFAPLVNPDGLLDGQAKRQNANGVDLNRNFPSGDWNENAVEYWLDSTGRNPRRYPGESAASEPEVQWIVRQIEEFDPDVIVSVHAPYHLLDFDGPSEAPDRIGELYLHQLGVYPGSLGNYAGIDKKIPVVTLELPSAGILPAKEQIRLMWLDLVNWLNNESRKNLAGN